MDKEKIFDITVTITQTMPVFPGDAPVMIDTIRSIKKGDICNLTSIHLGSHTGTHLDAPAHFIAGGDPIDSIGFDRLICTASVIEVRGKREIDVDELIKHPIRSGEAVLFKTENSALWFIPQFRNTYVSLTTEAAEYLANRQISLVGIDYLSIEKYGDNTSAVHRTLLGANIPILEGIDLSKVPQGYSSYQLICLPLKIYRAEGAPARAVLIKK